MLLSYFCNKNVPIVSATATIYEAAQLMKQYQTGYVMVVLRIKGVKKPLGILTDRDIIVRALSETEHLEKFRVEDIMSKPLFTARYDDTVSQASVVMRVNGISRLPIVDKDHNLIGVLEVNDLLKTITSELENVVKLAQNQLTNERRQRISLVPGFRHIGA